MSIKATRSAAGKGPSKRRKSAAPPRDAAPDSEGANGKRERNKAHNRSEILVAAREVFTELGYDRATVRDVIRRTKLASGTFYNYFPDKESVFRALFAESEERRHAWLRRVERGNDFEKYLRDTFRAYFEFVVSDRTTFELMRRNSQTIRAMSRDPIVVNDFARLRRPLAQAMEGRLLPRADLDFLTSAILGVAFEVAVIMVEREPVDVETATTFVTDLFLGFFARVREGEPAAAPDAKRLLGARA